MDSASSSRRRATKDEEEPDVDLPATTTARVRPEKYSARGGAAHRGLCRSAGGAAGRPPAPRGRAGPARDRRVRAPGSGVRAVDARLERNELGRARASQAPAPRAALDERRHPRRLRSRESLDARGDAQAVVQGHRHAAPRPRARRLGDRVAQAPPRLVRCTNQLFATRQLHAIFIISARRRGGGGLSALDSNTRLTV